MKLGELKLRFLEYRLENVADQILATARKCIRFDVNTTSQQVPLGASKIGGRPDLSDDAEWPVRDGRPLPFLAQINLSELPLIDCDSAIPRSGLLSFFYDVVEQPWGYDPKDVGSWRIHYADTLRNLERRISPSELPIEAQFAEGQLFHEEHYSLPSWINAEAHSLNLDEEQIESYDQLRAALQPVYPAMSHQMLGWPDEIQGPMDLECQLVSHGLYCGDPSGYRDPRTEELSVGASEWRLLLQLDSDDRAEMMWGDGGRLYFWMREQDLVDRRFESAWAVLQCF